MVNRKIWMTIGAMFVAAVLGLVFSQSLSVSAGPDLSEEDVTDKVKMQYPGEITELELNENGKAPVYEIEIAIDGKEYELLIDGDSGEVLKLDEKLTTAANEEQKAQNNAEKADEAQTENNEAESLQLREKTKNNETDKAEKQSSENSADKDRQTDNNEKTTVKAPSNKEDSEKEQPVKKSKQKQSIITNQEAIDIALEQFNGRVEGIELDEEDGRLVYEIELESSRGEADIEIDAYTGKVLVVDIDLEDD